MATRFRRPKASAKVCVSCHRVKGDRKVAKCPRCPGQSVGDTMQAPVEGVRIVAVDPGMDGSGIVVTSPTRSDELEVCRVQKPLSADPDETMRYALERSAADGAPCWLVIEDPGVGGPRANPEMILSVGQAIGMYRRAWVMAGGRDDRVVLVRQVSWQAGVIPGATDREARIDAAIAHAEEAYGGDEWTKDDACAACVAWFVLRWPEFTGRMSDRDREAAERVMHKSDEEAIAELGEHDDDLEDDEQRYAALSARVHAGAVASLDALVASTGMRRVDASPPQIDPTAYTDEELAAATSATTAKILAKERGLFG